MELPNISRQNNKGFTLIELIVTIAILTIIISLGLFLSFDFYKNYSFRSEKNVIVSVLEKARDQSISNIDQLPHGVHFQSNPTQYIIFEGSSYDSNNNNNIAINSSWGISITSPSTPFDIIFDQLSGCLSDGLNDCAAATKTITIKDQQKSYNITVNSQGQIDWQ